MEFLQQEETKHLDNSFIEVLEFIDTAGNILWFGLYTSPANISMIMISTKTYISTYI